MALEDYRNDMLRCLRCSCCKYIPLMSIIKSKRFAYGCPAVSKYNFHSYSGGGKLITSLSLVDGRIDYTDAMKDIIYRCTLCGSCDLSCRVGTEMEILETLFELRKKCFEDNGPMSGHKPILDSIKNYDNVWLQPRAKRGAWAKDLGLKDLGKSGEKADVLFYPGCTYAYNPNLQKVVKDTVTVLKKGGADIGILGSKEICCASPAFMVGDRELFLKYANQNIEMFNSLGVSKVVTGCAGCYSMFKAKYPLYGEKDLNFEVLHSIEYIDQLIKEGKLKPSKSVDMKVTYHDPCHLGRLSEPRVPSHGKETRVMGTLPVKEVPKVLGINGIFDPPREVIESIPGMELVEMERAREYSFCCGSGGGAKSAYPEFALWTSQERLEEAKSTGAQAVLSCCPWCESNLGDGIKESGSDMKVYDVTELLLQSL